MVVEEGGRGNVLDGMVWDGMEDVPCLRSATSCLSPVHLRRECSSISA